MSCLNNNEPVVQFENGNSFDFPEMTTCKHTLTYIAILITIIFFIIYFKK